MKRGVFITLEGGDGSGKSTLAESLFLYLERKKIPIIKTRAPGGTRIGKEIRDVVLSRRKTKMAPRCELLLFLADRAQHVEEEILPHLLDGKVVLCDRFNDSTFAYQGGARGFPSPIIRTLCDFACQKLQPDLTLYLDIDPSTALKRMQSRREDRIELEALEFHQNIRKAFIKRCKQYPKRMALLDASLPPSQVFAAAKEKIDALLSHR